MILLVSTLISQNDKSFLTSYRALAVHALLLIDEIESNLALLYLLFPFLFLQIKLLDVSTPSSSSRQIDVISYLDICAVHANL